MNTLVYSQVHRFGDRIALAIRGGGSKGETVYMTALDARLIGEALMRCADDVAKIPRVQDSQFPSRSISASDEGMI